MSNLPEYTVKVQLCKITLVSVYVHANCVCLQTTPEVQITRVRFNDQILYTTERKYFKTYRLPLCHQFTTKLILETDIDADVTIAIAIVYIIHLEH